jgi:phage terminase large subunit-like protein
MDIPTRAIENYEALSALTRELREAAARGEWDQLQEIQLKRSALFDSMVPVDSAATLDQTARQRKDELIQQVLADEAEIRELVHSHLAQLQTALQDSRQELRLLKEYGRQAG